jgi:hypothetical protein
MLALSQDHNLGHLDERLREAPAATAGLISEIIGEACQRFQPAGQIGKTTRVERLIESGAWTDAALALIELELPQWQVRRLAYDGGEWYCALSRQRELPEWLDQSVEAHHTDLPLAILSAFVNVRHVSTPSSRTSVPAVRHEASAPYEPVLTDNFA